MLNKPWILQGYHTYYLVFLFFCRYNIVRTILLFLFLSTNPTRLRMKVVLSKNLTHLAMDDKQVGNRRVHPSGFEYSTKALIFYPRKFRNLLPMAMFVCSLFPHVSHIHVLVISFSHGYLIILNISYGIISSARSTFIIQ